MCPEERARLIEDEFFLLADSGELPEVAYHSSLWCLCADPDGPRLTLTGAEKRQLQDAALRRCQRIILRDLTPAFRDRRIWRGPQRSRCNWGRYLAFCRRIGRQPDLLFQMQAAAALTGYLAQELAELRSGARERSSVNCTYEELLDFAEQLGCRLQAAGGPGRIRGSGFLPSLLHIRQPSRIVVADIMTIPRSSGPSYLTAMLVAFVLTMSVIMMFIPFIVMIIPVPNTAGAGQCCRKRGTPSQCYNNRFFHDVPPVIVDVLARDGC